jgi:hypothetical protein
VTEFGFPVVTIYDGVNWGWALVAVPEPASLSVLGLGAAALLLRRKK